jgi:hypothetical protein
MRFNPCLTGALGQADQGDQARLVVVGGDVEAAERGGKAQRRKVRAGKGPGHGHIREQGLEREDGFDPFARRENVRDGAITGAHRTWLAPDGFGKAPVDTPRRAMGGLLGHAVRFGAADDVLAAGEGIETMLSLRCALPAIPMAAALSANHLAALLLPPTLRRLYIARDADAAGDMGLAALTERAVAAGIEALALSPRTGDFNEDLRAFGLGALRAALRIQLAPQDVVGFLSQETARTG